VLPHNTTFSSSQEALGQACPIQRYSKTLGILIAAKPDPVGIESPFSTPLMAGTGNVTRTVVGYVDPTHGLDRAVASTGTLTTGWKGTTSPPTASGGPAPRGLTWV
jgi:hypothetical protein